MVNKTASVTVLALLLVLLPFAVAVQGSNSDVLSDEYVSDVFDTKRPISVSHSNGVLTPRSIIAYDATSDKTAVDISKYDELLERFHRLAQEVGRGDRVALPDDDARTKALIQVLERKGVHTSDDLKRFVMLNNIDVEQYGDDVANLVTSVQTAQYLGVVGFLHFQEGDLEAAERFLSLAEAQYRVYLYFEQKVGSQMDSWKPLSSVSCDPDWMLDEEQYEYCDPDFVGDNDRVGVVPDHKAPVFADDVDYADGDVRRGEPSVIEGTPEYVAVYGEEVVAVDADVSDRSVLKAEEVKSDKKSRSANVRDDDGFFAGFFGWFEDLF